MEQFYGGGDTDSSDGSSEGVVDPVLFFDYDHDVELGSVVCLYSQLVCVVLFLLWGMSLVVE
jgi:hypothetical protein